MSLVFFCPFTYMGVNNTKVLISLKPTTTENLIILRDLQALQVWTPYKQTFIDLSLIGKTRGFVLSSGAKSVKLLFLSYRKGGKWIVPASATVHLFSSGFRVNGAHLWPTVGPGVLDSVEQTKLWVPSSGGSDVGDDLGGSYIYIHMGICILENAAFIVSSLSLWWPQSQPCGSVYWRSTYFTVFPSADGVEESPLFPPNSEIMTLFLFQGICMWKVEKKCPNRWKTTLLLR